MGGFLLAFLVVAALWGWAIIGRIVLALFGKSRPWMRMGYRTVLGILVLGGVAVVYSAWGPDFLVRYDKPLTHEQALQKKISFPFPPTSHDIYYGMYADWQAYTELVRFTAPVEDCIKTLDSVLAHNKESQKGRQIPEYHPVEIHKVEPQGMGWLEHASWFTPEQLTNGLYAGEARSHTPQIWVDLDRGIFYLKETD